MMDVPVIVVFIGCTVAGSAGFLLGQEYQKGFKLIKNQKQEIKETKKEDTLEGAHKDVEVVKLAHEVKYASSSGSITPCKLESETTTYSVQDSREVLSKLKTTFSFLDQNQQIHTVETKDIHMPRYSLGIIVKKPLARIFTTPPIVDLSFGPEIGMRVLGRMWLNSHILIQTKEVGFTLRYEF